MNTNVLVVEDEKIIRTDIVDILTSFGFSCVEAGDGEQGLEAFKNLGPFKFVVTDLKMPKMDGFEMIRRIRQIDQSVPILMVSGYAEDFEAVSRSNYLVEKPFQEEDLEEKLKNLGLL